MQIYWKCKFYKCDFLSTTTWFENCENLINSELKFVLADLKVFSFNGWLIF
jgi:hypothetical protein